MPTGCKRTNCDCADFMDGCMVTKVPEMLREEQAWCHAWPDRPRVIGYVSILLNATGLRKSPCIGYTLARQIARCCWFCGRRGLPCGEDVALASDVSSVSCSGVPGLRDSLQCRLHQLSK